MSGPERVRQGTDVFTSTVQPEWIDINDHMNVAYYVLAFDLAVDAVWTQLGITDDYIASQKNSTFAVEAHVTYQRELRLDEPFVITAQLLAFDAKRIHQFMRMYHAAEGYLAATAEWLNLHVDMSTRRVSPWPDAILDAMHAFVSKQEARPLPAEVGRRINVRSPLWQVEGYR